MAKKMRKCPAKHSAAMPYSGVTVRLPRDKMKTLAELAENNNLPRSVYIRKIILDFLKEQ